LVGVRGIDRPQLVWGLVILAGDDQRVLAAELAGNLLQGGFHGLAVLGHGEVGERLVDEFAALDGGLNHCHADGLLWALENCTVRTGLASSEASKYKQRPAFREGHSYFLNKSWL